jgi:outer membrane protein OmpA-like peptidoglycan-associated protein
LEREAEAVSRAALDGRDVRVGSNAPLGLSRQAAPGPVPAAAPAAAPAAVVGTDPNTIDGFVTGSAVISAATMAKLKTIAASVQASLQAHPGSTVRVVGHTDAQGNEGDNVALGMRRAVATRNALAGMGVLAESMQVESEGQSEPVDLSGAKDSARNRRAEVKFEAVAPVAPPAPQKMDPNPPPVPAPQYNDPYKDPKYFPPLELPKEPQPLPGPRAQPAPAPPKDPGPIPKGAGPHSPFKIFRKAFDQGLKAICHAFGLSPELTQKIIGWAHDGVMKGTTAGLKAGMSKVGVSQMAQDAIINFVQGAIQENRWGE